MIAPLHSTATSRIKGPSASTDRIVVVFRNDDPSAISEVEHERRICAMFERHGVPQTIGVIPNVALGPHRDPHAKGERLLDTNPEMVALLREHCDRVGSEVALHGYTHRTSRLSIPSRREYFEFRDEGVAAQADKVSGGIEILVKSLNVRPVTFIPPWNRLDRDTVTACERNGLSIVSAGLWAPTTAGVTSLGTDCDLFNFPDLLRQALESDQRVYLRILFHSCTTRTPEELAALEGALELATQTPRCRVMTIQQAVDQFPEEVAAVNEAGRNVVAQDMLSGTTRARAVVYRRVSSMLGMDRGLAGLYAEAEQACRRGQYREAAGLSSAIDTRARRVLWGWRAGLAGLGAAVGLAIVSVLQPMSGASRFIGVATTALLIAGLTLVLIRASTAKDTRKEVAIAGCTALAGLMIGAMLGAFA